MKRFFQKTKASAEQGTVLLTTLLIMTVMAAITIALLDDIRVAVKRTINIQAYAQADWQAVGAEDFVEAYLRTDFNELPAAGQSALLLSQDPIVFPTPNGTISLTLKDASHCFNLNFVSGTQVSNDNDDDNDNVDDEEGGQQSGNSSASAELKFVELSKLLGLPENQAVALSKVLKDWQDADQQQSPNGAEDGTYLRKTPPYRTSDTALRGPEEMRALHGMDERLWELFRPFVCTGGVGLQPAVNINTLTPERLAILAAALSGEKSGSEALSAAEALLRDRPRTGYTEEQLTEAIANSGVEDLDITGVAIETTSIFVEVVTQVGPAERVRSYRYDGVDDTLRLTYRGWGRESFRPELNTTTQTEQDAR